MERHEIEARIAQLKKELHVQNTIANTGKINLNGTFGKLGSKWSIFYAPHAMIQVTITGQLALLMLIEMLEQCGISVISANTDGLVIRCRRDMEWLRDQCIAWWEQTTGFEMEHAEYASLYSRDVNNYIAVKLDRTVKLKGEYAPPDPGPSGWPNPTGQVCVDAVVAYLAHGVPLRDTIYACTDIRQFIYVRNVKGGGSYIPHAPLASKPTLGAMRQALQEHGVQVSSVGVSNDTLRELYGALRERLRGTGQYLGKAVRWYYGIGSKGCIVTPAGSLVAKTSGCVPMMTLSDELPADLDYEWYVTEARSLLSDLGVDTVSI